MKASKKKFTALFVAGAFGFLLLTSTLGQRPETLCDGSVAGIILAPFKLILIGPLVPFINFLHQDPDTPPPFFLAAFSFYWTLLGLGLHYILTKLKKQYESTL